MIGTKLFLVAIPVNHIVREKFGIAFQSYGHSCALVLCAHRCIALETKLGCILRDNLSIVVRHPLITLVCVAPKVDRGSQARRSRKITTSVSTHTQPEQISGLADRTSSQSLPIRVDGVVRAQVLAGREGISTTDVTLVKEFIRAKAGPHNRVTIGCSGKDDLLMVIETKIG